MTTPEIEVVIAGDAIERLAAAVDRPVLVVADANTYEAAGARVVSELRAARVDTDEFVFPQRTGLLASPEAVGRVRGQLGAGRLAVAVGAGVITDIVRYCAHECSGDFISVPTAASMDGYASAVAALELNGVKVTYPARPPLAIYADPGVALGAPRELTRAGLGDLLGKASARVDWLAGHLLYGEAYVPEAADLVLEPLSFAAARADGVLAHDPDAVQGLMTGLVRSGIAMTVAGSSRPASGCEHHASHFWDLQAARGMRPHHPHGLQVGYATGFALALQSFAFGGALSAPRRPVPALDPLGSAAREWLGDPSPQIVAAVSAKRRYVEDLSAWPEDEEAWAAVEARLAPALAAFDDVRRALTVAEFPAQPGYLDVDATMLRATFRYATRLRARYTVLDFLEGQALLEEAVDALVESGTTSASGRARESGGHRRP